MASGEFEMVRPPLCFAEEDLLELRRHGIDRGRALSQLELLRNGVVPPRVTRPCVVGDGIVRLSQVEMERCGRLYREEAPGLRVARFVPASGAATRMVRALTWLDGHCERLSAEELERVRRHDEVYYEEFMKFARGLPRLACFLDLKQAMERDGLDAGQLWEQGDFKSILSYLLGERGLGYASLPKALIKFHRYGTEARTALEEHLTEAAAYVCDSEGVCRIHFTVAPRHRERVDSYLSRIRPLYERRLGVRFAIQLSVQEPSTDTLALEQSGELARNEDGSLLLRPGGHGALLGNLERTAGELVFINNVDDVMHESVRAPACKYKMVLGGYLLELRREIFEVLRYFDTKAEEEAINVARAGAICHRLGRMLPDDFPRWDGARQRTKLRELLDRPIRVCGVVANRGEPGGGPFWVEGPKGEVSLQIVEQAQVNRKSKRQVSIFRSATHFNPVHIVCCLTNYRGERFKLDRFCDQRQAFVTFKVQGDRQLKVLELPGLWNGGMAFWNTVFVEVPREAFAPTKTICDLLKPAHLGE